MKKQPRRLNGKGQAGGFFAGALPLIGFLLFGAIPLAISLVASFTDLVGIKFDEMQFVGFQHYIEILTNADEATWGSYFTTFLFALNAPICIAISLWIAFLVNKTRIGKSFFRSVFFIPYVCSSVVVTLTFRNMLYRPEGGVLNELLQMMGYQPVGWLVSSPWLFMLSAIIMSVWSGLGWCIVLFQAALANVDQSYYEAAKLDGASDFKTFWKITWPAISPTTSFILTIKLIGAFQAMAEMFLLVGNGNTGPSWPFAENAWAADTVVKYLYNNIIYGAHYGKASAAGWVLAIVILIITRINIRTQKRWVSYDF